jgi:hypothetical protein
VAHNHYQWSIHHSNILLTNNYNNEKDDDLGDGRHPDLRRKYVYGMYVGQRRQSSPGAGKEEP